MWLISLILTIIYAIWLMSLIKPDFKPELMVITAGTLGDPSRHKPTMNIYAQSAQPWDYMDPHLPKIPKAPQFA